MTLREYSAGWWQWGTCPYTQRQLELGREPSPLYVQTRRGQLDREILPRLGSRLLSEITATDIHRLLVAIRDSGRSAATANHVGKTLMVMLKQAVRDGLLEREPNVQYLSETPKPRGVFRLEEVQRLLTPDSWKSVWSNDLLHYTLNATAACTGMRLGATNPPFGEADSLAPAG